VVDHRGAPVGAALLARLHARLAADAPALVDHEDVVAQRTRQRSGRRGGPGADRHRHSHDGLPSWWVRMVGAATVWLVATRPTSRSSTTAERGGPTRSTRTADTLYSGIFDSGSRARFVSWLADREPGQWYGMNTVSGRIVPTTLAGSSIDPRREVTRTMSPVVMPCCSASRGCSSHRGSGYCATSGPMRRVCVPDRYWLITRPVVSQTGYSWSTSSAGGR